mmetsp:Transcript_15002/g.41916  ORF Transcript_15002/g.41916 Transcript_15002/m.41916 type:complete len:197 (-) Transcript_15002:153-743(-)
MGGACCCCFPESAPIAVGDAADSGDPHEAFRTNLDAAATMDVLRTNPRVESFSAYVGVPQKDSFATLVPERQSFNTLVPDRRSFNTIIPDRQSFHTLPAVDSFSATSHMSYRTLVPDKRSFQTIPGTGSRPGSQAVSRAASFDGGQERLPAFGHGRTPELYKDSLEASAMPQTRLLDGRAAPGYGKGRSSSSPYGR